MIKEGENSFDKNKTLYHFLRLFSSVQVERKKCKENEVIELPTARTRPRVKGWGPGLRSGARGRAIIMGEGGEGEAL